MEPVSSLLLIAVVIVGAVKLIKLLAPKIEGVATIFVAVGIGVLIALIDQFIGATDISVAEGVITGLGAVGISTAAREVNTVVKG